jgi:signal transduction histidine kinase
MAQSPETNHEQKRVVILYPVRKDVPALATVEPVFERILKGELGDQLDYHAEYIDTSRFPAPEYQKALHDFLLDKYKGQRIDLVISTMTGVTNEFITSYRSDLFPDAAALFVLNTPDRPDPNSTGVYFYPDFKSSLELALKLQPDTQQVFVVCGSSQFDKYLLNRAKPQLETFSNRITLSYLTDMPMEGFVSKVASSPPHSIVFFIYLSEDSDGRKFVPGESAKRIAERANVPIYTWQAVWRDRGFVGGVLQHPEMISENNARLGLRILRGEKAGEIPLQQINPYVSEVDWRQLKRWGIDERRVPVGTLINFKEQGFWQLYRWRILVVGAVLVLQTLLIATLFVSRRRLRKAEIDSDEKRHVAQRLAARVLMLQDEERKRVAAELHDGLGQSLAIIKNRALMASRALPDAPRTEEQLQEIASTATLAIGEVREIAHNLRPYELDRLGLVAAIESMIERVSDSSSIDVSKNLDLTAGVLSSEAETSIYRIIQEALNNVVTHSFATEARVEIQRHGNQLAIRVQDNGIGIPTIPQGNDNRPGGFGLAGIAERVRALGGTFVIDSAAGKGTRLNISLELPS